MSQHIFTISTTDGRQHQALRVSYGSQEAAADALQRVMGWDEIHLSDDYTVSEDSEAVSAYRTEDECDADETGAHAPRIVARSVASVARAVAAIIGWGDDADGLGIIVHESLRGQPDISAEDIAETVREARAV